MKGLIDMILQEILRRLLVKNWNYLYIFLSVGIVLWVPIAASGGQVDLVESGGSRPSLIFISGEIDESVAREFYRISDPLDDAIVFLQSPGGYVEYGVNIGAKIAEKRFSTAVIDSDCASICVIIWLSGERRYMTKDSELRVHAAYRLAIDENGRTYGEVSGSANADIGAFLAIRGLSREAIRYVTNASPNEPLDPITPIIARLLEIDYILADSGQLLPNSGIHTPYDVVQLFGDLYGLSSHCSQFLDTQKGTLNSQSKFILDEGLKSYSLNLIQDRVQRYSINIQNDISNNGLVRWCLLAESRVRGAGFDSTVYGPSFDCAKSATRTEYALCDSKDLWAMDQAMASLYFFFRENMTSDLSRNFLNSQRRWLKSRNMCGSNKRCLEEKYHIRLSEFGV